MKKIFSIFLLILVLSLTSCGEVKGHDESEHQYIYYGSYAQSIIDDTDENEEFHDKLSDCDRTVLVENKMWQIEYNNEYYIRLKANLYEDELQIQEEQVKSRSGLTTMSNYGIYYFKVEPIKWRVIDESDDSYTLLCEYILDSHMFNSDDNLTNEFRGSSLYDYLNNEFYDIAFKDEEVKPIGDVLILGVDKMNIFTSKACRAGMSTDFARANGLQCSLARSSYGYANYWIDKADRKLLNDLASLYVDYVGAYDASLVRDVNFSSMGIRPVIKIAK